MFQLVESVVLPTDVPGMQYVFQDCSYLIAVSGLDSYEFTTCSFAALTMPYGTALIVHFKVWCSKMHLSAASLGGGSDIS